MGAFDEYMVRKGFSENTIKAFRDDLKIVQDFLGSDTRLHQVNTQHLHDFLDWLQHSRGKPCSAKSFAGAPHHYHQSLLWLAAWHWRDRH